MAAVLAQQAGGRVAKAPPVPREARIGILDPAFPRDPEMWRQQVLSVLGEAVLAGPVAQIDFARILSLPVHPLDRPRCPDPETYARTLVNPAAPMEDGKAFALRPLQIDALYEYETLGGLISPLGVGAGKTVCCVGSAKIGLQRRGHRRAVIMVPPEVIDQLVKVDIPRMRSRLSLDGIAFWPVQGSAEKRKWICEQPGSGVWIYTYSMLSTPTGEEELRSIAATLHICDEAQRIANRSSARTKRWLGVVDKIEEALLAGRLGPDVTAKHVEVLALSGTITRKSVKDYSHLAELALINASPVPMHGQSIYELSTAIDQDHEGTGLSEEEQRRVGMFLTWASQNGINWSDEKYQTYSRREMLREAYQLRLRSSPGVIGSSDVGVEASLIIAWSEPQRPRNASTELMVTHMQNVVEKMQTPDGDEIDFAMHSFKWLWELSSGFYNSLQWPAVDVVVRTQAMKNKPVSTSEATAIILASQEHHALLQAYHVQLRRFLKNTYIPKCDTPMLVAAEITRQIEGKERNHRLPSDLIDAYKVQKEARFDEMIERFSMAVRICDYKPAAAVQWAEEHAKKDVGGYIWFHHPELGRWTCELLKEAGIEHTFAPAGHNDAPFKSGIIVASYAHGTGKNLQHQSRNLFLELPQTALTMEQTIGRTHRSGQKADDVRCDVYVGNGFELALYNHLLAQADYIQATTGMAQRLCYATHSPVVPPVNPRLLERLGIVKRGDDVPRRSNIEAHQALTEPDALDWTSAFRSALYVAGEKT
jgi:hypothetical protein